ncbi:MAG: hypothetical protein JKY01_11950 [Pseudomonadales bacterium]|nr:hypothetical protein [Pseudomonadales bacterium]
MVESKVSALILTQLFIVLGLLITGLTIYVFYLNYKIQNTASNEAHEDNSDSLPANKPLESDKQVSGAHGNDAWRLETFIKEELDSNEKTYLSLSGNKIPDQLGDADVDADEKLLAILTRQDYLKAELGALEHRKDPEPFWAFLTPLLLNLASTLISEKTKKSMDELELKNHDLLIFQESFFSLQGLIREHLPNNHVKNLLPLTEEISLLTEANDKKKIPQSYEDCFKGISQLVAEKISPTLGAHTEEKNALSAIPSMQKQSISLLENFVSELREQNTLPLEQLDKYHNFVIELKLQFEKNEESFSQLKKVLAESEMCTQFLESELSAAQETVKTLMKNIEEDESAGENSDNTEKVKDLEELVGRFTIESRDMLLSIQMLQDENNTLRKDA